MQVKRGRRHVPRTSGLSAVAAQKKRETWLLAARVLLLVALLLLWEVKST